MNASMSQEAFIGAWSSLHGDVQAKGIVRGWLIISYRVARVFNKAGINANSLTLLGIVFAMATALVSPSLWSAIFLAISLALDGVDGSLAIVGGQVSKLGAIFDASADRISEGLWAIAFYRLGVPLSVVLLLWLLAAIQEYARARIGSAGVREIGIVTPAERPVRACFLFVAIIAWQINFAHGWTNAIAQVLVALQAISLVLVLRFAYKALR